MTESFLFKWRRAVVADDGPSDSYTRQVLLTLSLHMDENGGSCFPSTRLLAKECHLNRKTVEGRLHVAEAGGWIERSSRGGGQAWRGLEYQASMPEGGVPHTPPSPENVDRPVPHVEEGGPSRTPRQGGDVARPVPHVDDEGGVPGTQRGVPHGQTWSTPRSKGGVPGTPEGVSEGDKRASERSARDSTVDNSFREWLGEYSDSLDRFEEQIEEKPGQIRGLWASFKPTSMQGELLWKGVPPLDQPKVMAAALDAYAAECDEYKSHVFRFFLQDKARFFNREAGQAEEQVIQEARAGVSASVIREAAEARAEDDNRQVLEDIRAQQEWLVNQEADVRAEVEAEAQRQIGPTAKVSDRYAEAVLMAVIRDRSGIGQRTKDAESMSSRPRRRRGPTKVGDLLDARVV